MRINLLSRDLNFTRLKRKYSAKQTNASPRYSVLQLIKLSPILFSIYNFTKSCFEISLYILFNAGKNFPFKKIFSTKDSSSSSLRQSI